MALSGGTVAYFAAVLSRRLTFVATAGPVPRCASRSRVSVPTTPGRSSISASAVTLCESLDSLPIVVRILGSGAIAARCLLARRRVHDENLPALTVLGHQHIHFGGSIHPLAVRMHPPDLGRQLRSLDRMVTGWAAAGSKLT